MKRLSQSILGWLLPSALFLLSMDVVHAQAQIYVANHVGSSIGEYDASTGSAINSSLVSVGTDGFYSVAISDNDLYVSSGDITTGNGSIGVYNATTGAAINSSLISLPNVLYAMTLSGNTLYIANGNNVGVFNATTGAAINASLISSGLSGPWIGRLC